MGLFIFENRKKSQGVKSGEYDVYIGQTSYVQAMKCDLAHYRSAIIMT